jgi:hypothetical protein
MRAWLLIPLLLASGCGSSGPEEKKAARAASLEAGQYALESEVATLASQDEGAPAINTPAGTRASQNVCVGGSGRVPTELLSGEGYDCTYDNYYFRNGRINVLLSCTREGLQGNISMSVDGTFEAGQLSYDRKVRTILASDGDVQIDLSVTGRRTGDCTETEGATNEAAAQ